MITRFTILPTVLHLQPYVERIFVIESSGKLPQDDLKLIVPNGCPKLVFPFRNGLVATSSNREHVSHENKMTLIGMADGPAKVDLEHEGPAGNITVEFTAIGAYRFFNSPLGELTNGIFCFSDVFQKASEELEERLTDASSLPSRVTLIQDFLLKRIAAHPGDPVFDHCILQMMQTKGRVSLTQLERYTGYSSRWLNKKFQQYIGISPKNFSSIIRFQQYYQALVSHADQFFLEKEFYNYYYDRSHFIKDFKRFTGHSPVLLSKASNNYDRVFYRE